MIGAFGFLSRRPALVLSSSSLIQDSGPSAKNDGERAVTASAARDACTSDEDLSNGDSDADAPPAVELLRSPAIPNASHEAAHSSGEPTPSGSGLSPLPATPWQPDPSAIPCHTVISSKGVKKRLRFNAKWYQQYPWLHYDTNVNGFLCIYCARLGRRPAAANFCRTAAPIFLKTGFRRWRDAAKCFKRHAHSSCHQVATLEEASAGNIVQEICVANQLGQKKARSCLKIIITTLKFLARQGLSIRGSESDANSNLHQALAMRARDVPELERWMEGRFKWTSPAIQNELIKLLARDVSLKIADAVVGRPFAIICDGTTDVSGKEQEALCVRFVDDAGEVCEHFLCVIEPPDTTGKTLAAMIEGALRGYGLQLSDARGQGYDGAANMSGRHNGTQAIIKQTQPLALYVHCFAHCVNLTTEAMCKESAIVRNALGVCNEVGILFSQSHTFRRQFAAVASAEGPGTLRPLCPTRWTARGRSVSALLAQLGAAIEALEEDGRTQAVAMASALRSGTTVYGLVAAMRILSLMEMCNKLCQKRTATVSQALTAIRVVAKDLESEREDGWKEVEARTEKLIEEHELRPVQLPRGKVSRKLDSGPSGYKPTSVTEYLRVEYRKAIDAALQRVRELFLESPDIAVYEKQERMVLDGVVPETLIKDPKLDYDQLSRELASFRKQNTFDTLDEAAAILNGCSAKRELYAETAKLLDILRCIPVSSSEAERSFSKLRRLKTWLRNSMGERRLSDLLVCHIHQTLLDEVDEENVVKAFVAGDDARRRVFGDR